MNSSAYAADGSWVPAGGEWNEGDQQGDATAAASGQWDAVEAADAPPAPPPPA
jgi:hypothetical protein